MATKSKKKTAKQSRKLEPKKPAFTMKSDCDGCACVIYSDLSCELGYQTRRGLPEPGKISKLIPRTPCPKPLTPEALAMLPRNPKGRAI